MSNQSRRIAERLKERIHTDAHTLAQYFREDAIPERKPTKRQRAASFLQMTQEEKEQRFTETEPGKWGDFVQEEMDNAIEQFGSQVGAAYPFFASGLPSLTTPEEDTPEGELARLEGVLGISLGLDT